MRIGSWELSNIRNKILDHLYKRRSDEIEKRKIEIAKQNREYLLEPFQKVIDNLPLDLVAHSYEYMINVKYHPQQNPMFIQNVKELSVPENSTVSEYWIYKSKNKIINPVEPKGSTNNYYTQSPEQPLDPRLHSEAEKLCQDILTLRKERAESETYLVQTTQANQGSIKLRGVWPAWMHKFLPPEPTKLPKKSKKTAKVVVDTPEIPEHIEMQLTENLLEGN
jgi:hypothetical protein